MTTKKSELLYWDGTYWNNAAHRYWDGDSWENDRDDGSPQTTYPTNENPLINLVITDIIGYPKSAKFVIANPSREVYSSTAAKQAGRFTGVFTDFQNISKTLFFILSLYTNTKSKTLCFIVFIRFLTCLTKNTLFIRFFSKF